jgi:hypothetical protein
MDTGLNVGARLRGLAKAAGQQETPVLRPNRGIRYGLSLVLPLSLEGAWTKMGAGFLAPSREAGYSCGTAPASHRTYPIRPRGRVDRLGEREHPHLEYSVVKETTQRTDPGGKARSA